MSIELLRPTANIVALGGGGGAYVNNPEYAYDTNPTSTYAYMYAACGFGQNDYAQVTYKTYQPRTQTRIMALLL